MQGLEKILKEIDEIKVGFDTECRSECDLFDWSCGACVGECDEYIKERAKDIIRKHMNDGWIPVEERLPEVGEYVLGTTKLGEVLIYRYGWNSPHSKKMFFHLCGAAAIITAWMPCPDPYRPERSEG